MNNTIHSALVDLLREGEDLHKKAYETNIGSMYSMNSLTDHEVDDWCKNVVHVVNTSGLGPFGGVYFPNQTPLEKLTSYLSVLREIVEPEMEENTPFSYPKLPPKNFDGVLSPKTNLRLIYSGSEIYDFDNPSLRIVLKSGFRKDILSFCFESPSMPKRAIPLETLVLLNKSYNLNNLNKKEGFLESLYEHWRNKFKVKKSIINKIIYFSELSLRISDNIQAEGYSNFE
jgi:hypothetical protein